ncbi:hypothetical protein PoMZ_00831 [Pyricularia oryzae]|uniref:Uncharacterized protein n=1 Tax=Pyricularia oryzae TaxID=318829 RepID=A0A4V1C5C7_PYROR|nr:hypothetical protein PoMZ_00831 [Pyricularia oryzae]
MSSGSSVLKRPNAHRDKKFGGEASTHPGPPPARDIERDKLGDQVPVVPHWHNRSCGSGQAREAVPPVPLPSDKILLLPEANAK